MSAPKLVFTPRVPGSGSPAADINAIATSHDALIDDVVAAAAAIALKADKAALAAVATTGNYNDLINKPATTASATSAMTSVVTGGVFRGAFAAVAYALYDCIIIPAGQLNAGLFAYATAAFTATATYAAANWTLDPGQSTNDYTSVEKAKLGALATVATSGNYTDLANKPIIPVVPTLATVATSGSYTDLTNKPIAAGLPVLATVATTGSYTDLVNKPVTPTLATVATTGNYADLLSKPVIPVLPALATVATSGSYTDLTSKPVIPVLPVLATVATSGSYTDLTSKPVIPAAYTDAQAVAANTTAIANEATARAAADTALQTQEATNATNIATNATNIAANVTAITLKVDKVTGLALSSNDYTSPEKAKLAGLTAMGGEPFRQLLIGLGMYPAWDNRPLQLVRLGDSITFGVSDVDCTNALTPAYVSVNKGIGGNTTAQMLARFATDVTALYTTATYAYNFLYVSGCTNDANLGLLAADIADRTRQLIQAGTAAGYVVVLGTTTPTTIAASNTIITQVNNLLRLNWQQYGAAALADQAVVPQLANPADTTYYNADGTHQNAAGIPFLIATMVSTLKPLLLTRRLPLPGVEYLAATGEGVVWTNIIGGTATGNSFAANGPSSAMSSKTVGTSNTTNEARYMQFTVANLVSQVVVGFDLLANAPTTDMPSAVFLANNNLFLRSGGANQSPVTVAVNDVVRLQVYAYKMSMWVNGIKVTELVMTPPSAAMPLKLTFTTAGTVINNVRIYGSILT